MTYSRPSIRQTNANAGAPNPGRVRIGGSPTVRTGAGFSYSDRFVDSSLAGKTAGQDAAAIANFFQAIQEPVVKVGEALDIQKANRQVGDLIANNPDLPELFRTSPESVQNEIRSLSPRAQDIFLSSTAESGVVEFQKRFAAAAAADSLLTQPTSEANREAQADRYRELKAKEMEAAGLTSLPARYIGAVSSELAQYEAGVKGQLHAFRLEADAEAKGLAEGSWWGGKIATMASQLPAVDAQFGDQVAGLTEKAQQLNAEVAVRVEKNLADGNLTFNQTMNRLWEGFSREFFSELNDGEIDSARAQLRVLEAAADGEVRVGKNGINFWDLRIAGANGTSNSIQERIQSARKVLEAARKDKAAMEAANYIRRYASRLVSGDAAARKATEEELRNLISVSGLEPEAIFEVLKMAGNLSTMASAATERQKENLMLIQSSDDFIDGTSEQKYRILNDAYTSGDISINQALGSANQISQQSDVEVKILSGIKSAREAVRNGELGFNKRQEFRDALGQLGSFTDKDLESAVNSRNELAEARAWTDTYQEVREGIEAGNTYSKEDIKNIFQENYRLKAQAIIDDLNKAAGITGSTKEKVKSWLTLIQENIRANPEVVKKNPGAMFPEKLVDEATESAVRNGTPRASVDWKDVLRYLAKRMASVKDESGEPTYGKSWQESQDWFRKTYQQISGEALQGLPAERTAPNRSERRNSRRSSSSKEGDQAKNDENFDPVSFIKDGLGQVAGLILPGGGSPAAAGTLTENEENLPALARAYSGRAPVSLATPPLPQVAASAQTQPIPLAIKTSNHPFSIAIGIAEGTRTPSGGKTRAYYGHTDPGNGASNTGTYSAQQGMSPAQADAYWSGKLTQTQMRVSPLLEAAGIKRGTHGYNRLMFNVLDLAVQAPLAVKTFLPQIPKILSAGLSIEAIAKARADAFYNPETGRLEAAGFGNSYQRLFRDQRSRAGVWDYRRRI